MDSIDNFDAKLALTAHSGIKTKTLVFRLEKGYLTISASRKYCQYSNQWNLQIYSICTHGQANNIKVSGEVEILELVAILQHVDPNGTRRFLYSINTKTKEHNKNLKKTFKNQQKFFENIGLAFSNR